MFIITLPVLIVSTIIAIIVATNSKTATGYLIIAALCLPGGWAVQKWILPATALGTDPFITMVHVLFGLLCLSAFLMLRVRLQRQHKALSSQAAPAKRPKGEQTNSSSH